MKESKRRLRKENIVNTLSKDIENSEGLLVLNYKGLSSELLNSLRDTIKSNNNAVKAVKKTLLKITLKNNSKYEKLSLADFEGQSALVILKNNPIETIKNISEFAKKNNLPEFEIGLFEGNIIEKNDFSKLAALPGKNELQAIATALIKNPLNRIVYSLKNNQTKLVLIMAEIAKKK